MPIPRTRATAMGLNGAIATPHYLASTMGLRVLQDGGNALDACVAACAALGVLRPDQCGIGGDLFLLIWTPRGERLMALNASGRAGAKATPEFIRAAGHRLMPEKGPLSVVVPGCVAGWAAALERFGTRELEPLLQPAIQLAEQGFPVVARLAGFIQQESPHLNDAARRVFMPGGRAPRPGDVLRAPEYGAALRSIARDGPEVMYDGPVGHAIGRFLEGEGAHLTAQDIAAHSCQWVEPAAVQFLGFHVCAMPPNTQALLQLMALQTLAPLDLGAALSARSVHLQAEAIRLACQDRWRIADPTFVDVPVGWLLSSEHAAEARQQLSFDRAHRSPALTVASDTVALCAADRDGSLVSLIQSVRRPFGSGLVVPGTGIVLNDRAMDFGLDDGDPNQIAPGKRPRHTLCPGMTLRDGKPVLALCTAGEAMQPITMLQLTCHLLAFEMDPQEALDAPRWRLEPPELDSEGPSLGLEHRFPQRVRRQLQAMGYSLARLADFDDACGRASVVQVDHERGIFLAGADPRADGLALAY